MKLDVDVEELTNVSPKKPQALSTNTTVDASSRQSSQLSSTTLKVVEEEAQVLVESASENL